MKSVNYILFLLILSFLPSLLIAQKLPQVRQKEFEETIGPVLSVEERYYTSQQMPSIEEFDKEKEQFLNKITYKAYNQENYTFIIKVYVTEDLSKVRQFTQYTFNAQGDKIKHLFQDKYYQEVASNHLVYQDTHIITDSLFLVNSNGKDSLASIFEYKYDKSGNLAEEKELNSSRKLEQRKTYRYNQAGKLAEKRWYVGKNGFYSVPACGGKTHYWFAGDTTVYRKWIYLYDNLGNVIEEAELTNMNCALWKKTREYNKAGNKIKEVSSENEQISTIWKGNYNEHNKLIAEWYYSGKEDMLSSCTYQYDKHGNLTEKNTYDSNNILTTSIKKSYDQYGNWIRKEVQHWGKLFSVTERKIVYE